ncbi:MAG TPA: hypothetical protein VM120_11945 [Bryobacteraceae bacterium]|nr:hypothetical protein [Bryobacteraceae bacterium]
MPFAGHAMKLITFYLSFVAGLWAAPCSLDEFKPQPGLAAGPSGGDLQITWQGEHGYTLRATFGLSGKQPLIRELAARKAGAAWAVLGTNLRPEFTVTSGLRRISNQQLTPLKALGLDKPEIIEGEKWKVFWDAPLNIPGSARTNPGLPRKPEEVRIASATYDSNGCSVRSEGSRLEVTYPGLSMGIFSGRLVFTVYKGSNLLRQEAIARTDEPAVAYKYNAGLKGFAIDSANRVVWRDVARAWQKYEFGGANNRDPVALRARNRLAIVETPKGSLAVFPPPHKFFFAREIELNLGYVWYRKDSESSFSVGVRHGDHEEMYRPHGVSDEVYNRRANQSRSFAQGNFALYNAPPGTWQRMSAYYYLSAENGEAAQKAVMAYTHDDTFKPLPGYKVAISHFHTHFNELLTDAGTLDAMPNWLPTFRAMGVNIAMMSDFHGDGHATDPGPLRFHDQNVYFEGCRRFSDKDFLIMPGEEPDAFFGGHYTTVFPRPVFWSHVRKDGQQFIEQDPKHGKVYHVGNAREEFDMVRREGGLVWQAHPRTKGSSGHPEAIRNTEYFQSDNYLGASYQSLPVDLSEQRLCEVRCFGTLDDMNNWGKPKYLIAEGDTYQKFPEDDTFSHLIVNYVKLDKLPRFDEDWSPILKAMRSGDFFVSSGEVLIRNSAVEGSGPKRTFTAEVEWTFPLEFVELVWGDGQSTNRQIIPATAFGPHSSNKFRIPFDTAGRKWVRFAAWDSAGNGAFTQPVHLLQGSAGR